MKKTYTKEEAELMWWLGFTSGRVQETSNPKQGVSPNEEKNILEKDYERFIFHMRLKKQQARNEKREKKKAAK